MFGIRVFFSHFTSIQKGPKCCLCYLKRGCLPTAVSALSFVWTLHTALKYIEMMATLKVHISRVQGRGGAPKRNKWANLSGHDGVGVILRLSAYVCVGRSRSGCVPSYDGHSPFMVHAKVVRRQRGLCAGNERTRKCGVVLMGAVEL